MANPEGAFTSQFEDTRQPFAQATVAVHQPDPGVTGMTFATALRCRECSRDYPLKAINVCEYCFGPVEVAYDYDAIKKKVSRERIERGPASLWRYEDFLPCDADGADRKSVV